VNPSKKVLLAAAVMAAGFGAASLFGTPRSPLPPQAAPASDCAAGQPPRETDLPLSTAAPAPLESLRLIPDAAGDAQWATTASHAPLAAADRLRDATVAVAGAPQTAAASNAPMRAIHAGETAPIEPRAKLRDEAPRPLGIGPRAEVTMGRVKPTGAGVPIALDGVRQAGGAQSMPSMWEGGDGAAATGAAVAAPGGHAVTSDMSLLAKDRAPLPLPRPSDDERPRTHILVDGDSLPKLAGRYLDDPRRAEEIYELNRHLLSDPDLLPIGVELLLPPRGGAARAAGPVPHSLLPRSVAIHLPAAGGLVPVRPIPSASAMTPRARLVNPRPAE
jgi:nucleoid-associated protein YgaU